MQLNSNYKPHQSSPVEHTKLGKYALNYPLDCCRLKIKA